MDIDVYLKILEEASSDSEREVNEEISVETIKELGAIPRRLKSIMKFSRYKLHVRKISTNVRNPKDKW